MARAQQRGVYAPPPQQQEWRGASDDGGDKRQGMILAIMFVVIVASGYVFWTMFGSAPADRAPVIAGPDGGFKQRYDGPATDEVDTPGIDGVIAGKAEEPPPARAATVAEAEPVSPAPATQKAKAQAAPRPAAAGQYVAQIAALRSAGAADTAWNRLAGRDPALFASAAKDVQRADLGAKGVYYRVRAGYFGDRDEAVRFCDRVRALGQECIVVAR